MPKEEKEPIGTAAAESRPAEEGVETSTLITSAALIGIGALIEPELLAGMAIGAGIVFASKWFPSIVGDLIRPIAKTAVKAGYAAAVAAREAVAGMTEEVEDMMAEARAEHKSEQLH